MDQDTTSETSNSLLAAPQSNRFCFESGIVDVAFYCLNNHIYGHVVILSNYSQLWGTSRLRVTGLRPSVPVARSACTHLPLLEPLAVEITR
jgi:hypothetical protein